MSGQYDGNYYYTGGYNYGQPTSSYPSEGFAYQNTSSYPTQPYYGQPQSHNSAAQYYNSSPSAPQNGPQYSDDRGLLGAMAGGATGAYGGHKMGHGVLGAIGGAILGSLTEDYAKGKNKKHKKTSSHHNHHHHQQQHYHHSKHGSTSSNSSQGSAFGGLSNAVNGLGPMASSFFGSHHSKR